jgi:glycosyltransferase involved in cell wall biosynthesis
VAYYFDATVSLRNGLNTGIQRVVCGIAQEAVEPEMKVVVSSKSTNSLQYIAIEKNQIITYLARRKNRVSIKLSLLRKLISILRPLFIFLSNFEVARRLRDSVLSYLTGENSLRVDKEKIETCEIKATDTYVTFDAFWNSPKDFERLEAAASIGSRVVILVHDFFPLSHPEWFERTNIANFKMFFLKGVDLADLLVFSSEATLESFNSHFVLVKTPRVVIRFGTSFNSQINLNRNGANQRISSDLEILMIGTVEPRKNYIEVLKWFERNHLGRGLTIIGRDGWKSRDVKLALLKLKCKGVRVKWLKQVSDKDLEAVLEHTDIGLCASLDEGYGLPLREFLNAGIPAVASDIPVFREADNQNIDFFRLGDIESLEKAVAKSLTRGRFTPVTTVNGWQSTYKSLLQALNEA